MKQEKVLFYVESKNGHDTKEIDTDKVQEETEKQLKQDKLVTVEQESGEKEVLTKSDIPQQEDKIPTEEEQKENREWAKKFKNTKSATVTNKEKGF